MIQDGPETNHMKWKTLPFKVCLFTAKFTKSDLISRYIGLSIFDIKLGKLKVEKPLKYKE